MVILKKINRRRYWFIIIPILFAIVLPIITLAQSGDTPRPAPVNLADSQDKYPLGLHLELLEDPTGQLTIEDVSSPAYDDQFTPSQAEVPNFGSTSATIWAKFQVRNQTEPTTSWRLAVEDARLKYVDLYLPAESEMGWVHQPAGRLRPFTIREVPYRYAVFKLPLVPGQTQTVYLRVQSDPLLLPLTLWSLEAFTTQAQTELLVFGLFYGFLLAMLGYHLFLFISLRSPSYLFLALFIVGFGLNDAFREGLAQQYLWPNQPNLYGIGITAVSNLIVGLLIGISFLQTKDRTPKLHKAMVTTIIIIPIFYVLTLLGWVPGVGVIFALLIVFLLVVAGYLAWKQGYRPAGYYLLAWLFFFGTTVFQQLTSAGLLPGTSFDQQSMRFGLALTVLLLSLALADRINLLRAETSEANEALEQEVKEKESAQLALLESEKKYRNVVEQATEGIMIVQDYERKYFNPAFLEITGYSAEAYEALPFMTLIYADDADAVENKYQKLLTGQEIESPFEFRIINKSGEIKWLSTHGSTIEWEGKPAGMVFAQDITERKQIEIELRQYHDRLEELVAERTGQLSAFLDMTMLVSEARTLPQVVDVAIDRIMEFCRCQTLILHLLDDDCTTLNLLTQRGLTLTQQEHFQTISLEVPLSDWLLQRQEPLLVLEPDKFVFLPVVLQLDDCKAYIGVQLRAGEKVLGMLSYYRFTEETFSVDEVSLLVALAEQLSIIIENHRLRDQIQENAVVTERHRLARDLHDSITQSLYSINLFSHATRQAAEIGDAERLDNSINRVEAISQTALKEMRLLLYQLRPPLLTEKSLVEVLELRFDSVERRLGIEVDYQIEGDFDLPAEIAEDVYWVAIETLNNSLKHAEASRVSVQLVMATPKIALTIADDGRGFDPDRVNGGMGLPNIRERVEQLAGRLTIKSAPGAGTTTAITVNAANASDNGR
jgi:PAS domain S-box-containing protein